MGELSGDPAHEWPDRDLVVAFQAGERWAYDEMYRRYGTRVHMTCLRLLGNAEDAHEAAQETFLKAYQALPRFNGNYRLGAWLSRIAANVSLDNLRARGRGAALVPLPEHRETPDADPGPEEVIATDDRAIATLEEIQPLHARALHLRAIEGMSHKEMADRLAMTPAQVKALLHRARFSFKRAWENASGWIVAPWLGIRSLIAGSDKGPAGAPVVALGSSSTPLLAEKVAASAMVVAAALSGVAGGGPTSTSEAGTITGGEVISPDATGVGARAPVARTAGDTSGGEAEATATLVAQVTEIVERRVTRKVRRKRPQGGGGGGDGGGSIPSNPERTADEVAHKAKQKIDEITRS